VENGAVLIKDPQDKSNTSNREVFSSWGLISFSGKRVILIDNHADRVFHGTGVMKGRGMKIVPSVRKNRTIGVMKSPLPSK